MQIRFLSLGLVLSLSLLSQTSFASSACNLKKAILTVKVPAKFAGGSSVSYSGSPSTTEKLEFSYPNGALEIPGKSGVKDCCADFAKQALKSNDHLVLEAKVLVTLNGYQTTCTASAAETNNGYWVNINLPQSTHGSTGGGGYWTDTRSLKNPSQSLRVKVSIPNSYSGSSGGSFPAAPK
jgi:hypothetical protein